MNSSPRVTDMTLSTQRPDDRRIRFVPIDGGERRDFDVVSADEAARMALDLPEVTEGERYGNRTWSVRGKAFAWERPFSKADIRRYGDVVPPAGPIFAARVADLSDKEPCWRPNPRPYSRSRISMDTRPCSSR